VAGKEYPISPEAERVLLANPSVVGFAQTLRRKLVRGKRTRILAIQVFVEEKRATVADALRVPSVIDGIPTDVVAIGPVEPIAIPNQIKQRPLVGGCSGIRTTGRAGTLGYFMRDKQKKKGQTPQWYALSCAHVLDPGTPNNQETLQPSPDDGGKRPQDWVGKLYKSTYSGTDAALSKIDIGAKADIIGLFTPVGRRAAKNKMTVVKSGRSTGITTGTVVDVALTLKPNQWGRVGAVVFKDVIAVEGVGANFVAPGDSGSLVMEKGARGAVGMVFGANFSLKPARAYVTPMVRVEGAFPAQMMVLPGETYP